MRRSSDGDQEAELQTTRSIALREAGLDPGDVKTVDDVEKYGRHIIHVTGSSAAPGWSYTVGVYDTCGKPELIVIGLKVETAGTALNKACDLLKAGTNLTSGRHAELVGEVDVEFREVDPAWAKELMGWAKWYQGSWDFPVLQMIYPDLENRFQWEEGFTEYFRQPLLQVDAPQTDKEDDFKASADPVVAFSIGDFLPPHTPMHICRRRRGHSLLRCRMTTRKVKRSWLRRCLRASAGRG